MTGWTMQAATEERIEAEMVWPEQDFVVVQRDRGDFAIADSEHVHRGDTVVICDREVRSMGTDGR